MTKHDKLQLAFNLLPNGYKKLCGQAFGCTVSYFNMIVTDPKKGDDLKSKALEAVKQTANQAKREVNAKVKKIQSI